MPFKGQTIIRNESGLYVDNSGRVLSYTVKTQGLGIWCKFGGCCADNPIRNCIDLDNRTGYIDRYCYGCCYSVYRVYYGVFYYSCDCSRDHDHDNYRDHSNDYCSDHHVGTFWNNGGYYDVYHKRQG